jgi:predicted ABC-type ATPase
MRILPLKLLWLQSTKVVILLKKKNPHSETPFFFWLQNVDLAIERVKTRVMEGGHNIETEVIKEAM